MPTKRRLNQLNQALVMATCVLPLFLSSEKMVGATLTLNSDTSFTDALNLIDAALNVNTFVNAESLSAEALAPVNKVNPNTAFLEGLPNQSSSESVNASLSLQSVLGSLSQLRLGGSGNQGAIAEIPILPQVQASDVFKEVYDFTPKVSNNSPQPVNGIFFSAETFAPVPSLENFTPGRVSLPAPSIALPVQGGALSPIGVSQGTGISAIAPLPRSQFVGSVAQLSNPLNLAPKIDARFGILPGGNPHLTLKDINQGLSAVAKKLDQYDLLTLKTNFRLMPKTTLVTGLKLTNDDLKSTLIRRDLDIASSRLKNQLQQNSQQYQEEINRRQNEYQQKIQQNFEEQQRRQQQFEQEIARRQQEEQRRLFQEQQEQQRQLQENIQRQLEEQRQQQERLAQQLEQQRQQQGQL